MNLKAFFEKYRRVAIAFSGGVDSAYLLYAAKQYAEEVRAYYVNAEFQPRFELEDAVRLARELDIVVEGGARPLGLDVSAEGGTRPRELDASAEGGTRPRELKISVGEGERTQGLHARASMKILDLQVLSSREVRSNPANRCYYCKQGIFGAIWKAAKEDGFEVLLDGTNASDDAGDRPGMKALRELQVLSPLRECGLTKDEIRTLSKEAGLFTWNKPAYACLATRIPTGEEITQEKLQATEAAESYLFSLGFTDFRVRSSQGNARLQLREDQWELLIKHRREILAELSRYYKTVALDLVTRG